MVTSFENREDLYLRLLNTEGLTDKLLRSLTSYFLRIGDSIDNYSVKEISDFYAKNLGRQDIALKLNSPNERVSQQISEIKNNGIKFISIDHCSYPSKLKSTLGEKSPPILSYFGNIDLLERSSLGFCGSRKASARGIETARDCADQAAAEGFVVVSGNAAGVDETAHSAALKNNGSTILSLPEGILRFNVRKSLRDDWETERVLVVSQFSPGMPWSGRQAMERNKTIIGLSDVMIVIEAGDRGGTINCGEQSLKLEKPLYVAMYEGAPTSTTGNDLLLAKGGKPLMKSRTTGRASIQRLFAEASYKPQASLL